MVRVEKSYDRLNKKWLYDIKHGAKFLTRARSLKEAQFTVKQLKKSFKNEKLKKMWLK